MASEAAKAAKARRKAYQASLGAMAQPETVAPSRPSLPAGLVYDEKGNIRSASDKGLAASVAVPSPGANLGNAAAAVKAQAAGMDVPSWVAPAALGAGGLVVAGGATALAVSAYRKRKRKSSVTSSRKGSKSRSRPGKGGVVRGKKDRNRRGGAVRDRYRGRKVYRTKRGQPYILMANGKARFVRA